MNKYVHIYSSEFGVTALSIHSNSLGQTCENDHLRLCKQELKDYFNGETFEFTCKLDLEGTDFQKKVWKELKRIPYGKSYSYKDVALKVGGANYARAVGMANNKNPVPILIPCHRVIGKSGDLTGFGGGLSNKEILLNLEQSSF